MIVVDSSSIISLAVNCMCPIMESLDVGFLITPKVYEEIISKPSTNKRFALESMRIKRLVSSGAIGVKAPTTDLHEKILEAANRIYSIRGSELKIIHNAEAEALSLADEVGARALMIDERTMRLLIEDPVGLKDLLAYRNRAQVRVNEIWLKRFKDVVPKIPIIRSAEIVAIAYERGLLTRMHDVEDKSVLDAALAALKFSGCAISWEEIEEYQKAVI
jgi:predicted nucleic acid-binding protein